MAVNWSDQLLQEVIVALKEAGYNPYDQLEGYVQIGDSSYITRFDGARDMISNISREIIKEYLEKVKRYARAP